MGSYTPHGFYLPDYEEDGTDHLALYNAAFEVVDDLIGDIIAAAVTITGNQTVAGVKTFSSFPVLPSATPTTDYQAATKKYVDDHAAGGGASIPSGAVLAFLQATVPAGWTQDTSMNDKVIRIVDGQGGTTGGSWTLSGLSAAGHVLTINEMPSHNHNTYALVNAGGYMTFNLWSSVVPGSAASSYTGGGQAHTHGVNSDGTWRPAYVDSIVCVKD